MSTPARLKLALARLAGMVRYGLLLSILTVSLSLLKADDIYYFMTCYMKGWRAPCFSCAEEHYHGCVDNADALETAALYNIYVERDDCYTSWTPGHEAYDACVDEYNCADLQDDYERQLCYSFAYSQCNAEAQNQHDPEYEDGCLYTANAEADIAGDEHQAAVLGCYNDWLSGQNWCQALLS